MKVESPILWIHIPDRRNYENWTQHIGTLRGLKLFVENGGGLFLTGFGALLPHAIGLESRQPEIQTIEIKNDWNFDERGLQSYRGHPAFHGLFGGAFLWDATDDMQMPAIGYFGPNMPEQGLVAGVERSYVTLSSDRRLLIEYRAGRGRVLSVGAYVDFSKANRQRDCMEIFVRNCIEDLAGRFPTEPRTYWPNKIEKPIEIPTWSQSKPPTPAKKIDGHASLQALDQSSSGLCFMREKPKNDFFDLAGRRMLIMGGENGGIDEIWVHPFRLLREYQAGLLINNDRPQHSADIQWLKDMPAKVEIRPESLTRIYQTPQGRLTETIFPSLNEPGGIVQYRNEFKQSARLMISFRSDLRWMWPYNSDATGTIRYGFDPRLNAIHIEAPGGNIACLIGADAVPTSRLTGPYDRVTWADGKLEGIPTDANQIAHGFIFDLHPGKSLNVAITGTDEGSARAENAFHNLLADPDAVRQNLARHYRDLIADRVTIDSPDQEFNTLWKWALVGTDRFLAMTPGLGTGLLAGFSTTVRGWDGAQKISGRPGYAWYFGRDSAWSGFAIDDYGDFETVRQQLEFLQHFQAPSGKIFHEVSTSGVIHYDSADATPLYLILVDHYLRASGDKDFLAKSRPHIQKALDYLFSTDTDHDGLIEDTDVGHGWVEGGKLFGAHTEIYLAALWARALESAVSANCIDRQASSAKIADELDRVRKIINSDFWNSTDRFLNYGKLKDGSYNKEKTVLPAVPLYFHLIETEKAVPVLEELSRNGFSTDWGVRILPSSSPLFDPEGYHEGSVWPLFTGWTALAEYEYGRPTQGFTHIINNLYIKNNWAAGFVQEVMNGTTYQPSGVCPHQCWSETNILHPGIEGMIGWRPNACYHMAFLKPRFPLHWDHTAVHNLRVGNSIIDMDMERSTTETRYSLTLLSGAPIKIHLEPDIVEGMTILKMECSKEAIAEGEGAPGCPPGCVIIQLTRRAVVMYHHTGGVGMIPVMPKPKPEDTSLGYRIISTHLNGTTYQIELEGKSGTEGTYEMNIFDNSLGPVTGATADEPTKKGLVRLHVPFDNSDKEFTNKTVIVEITQKVNESESGKDHLR